MEREERKEELTSKNPLSSWPFETLDDYMASESALKQCQTAQSVFLTSSNNKKSLSSGKVQLRSYDLETAKKHLSQPNMNLENSNKIVELANSFLNSPFMKQLWNDSLNKQKLFKGLSNIKDKGTRFC